MDQRRPYLELGDAVRAIEFVLDRRVRTGLFNVLTANATVREIVSYVKAAVPDLEIAEVDSRVMNQLSYEVDGSRFRSLGFEARGDLQAAISETVEMLRGANSVRTVARMDARAT